ncbi:MAG: hypothetical protein AAGM22_21820 [Acidobacteriota bacterium]
MNKNFLPSRIALAALGLVFVLPQAAEAQIGVSPSRFEIDLDDDPRTHAVRVLNEGGRAADLTVRVVHWDLDEHNEVRIVEPTEQSLDQWLVVNPLHFSLEPGASQTVRFAIRPRVEPDPGEHRAMLFFEQQAGGGPSGIQVMFRLGVAIYGQVGDATRTAELHDVTSSGVGLGFDLSSLGSANARLAGEFSLRSVERSTAEDDFVLTQPLPSTPVLPGTRRTVWVPFHTSVPPGDYAVALRGHLGDDALNRDLVITVPAPFVGAPAAAGAP